MIFLTDYNVISDKNVLDQFFSLKKINFEDLTQKFQFCKFFDRFDFDFFTEILFFSKLAIDFFAKILVNNANKKISANTIPCSYAQHH